MSRIAIVLASLLLLWHPLNSSAADAVLRDVVLGGESGFIDLRFHVLRTQSVVLPDGTKGLGLVFGGSLNGRPVRMGLTIMRAWKEQPGPLKFFTGSVSFFRIDSASDELVRRLAGFYKVRAKTNRCAEDIFASAVLLGGSPSTLESKPVQMKVFFEGATQEDYGELYVNLDLKNGVVELNEKDPDYRTSIIRAFTGAK